MGDIEFFTKKIRSLKRQEAVKAVRVDRDNKQSSLGAVDFKDITGCRCRPFLNLAASSFHLQGFCHLPVGNVMSAFIRRSTVIFSYVYVCCLFSSSLQDYFPFCSP